MPHHSTTDLFLIPNDSPSISSPHPQLLSSLILPPLSSTVNFSTLSRQNHPQRFNKKKKFPPLQSSFLTHSGPITTPITTNIFPNTNNIWPRSNKPTIRILNIRGSFLPRFRPIPQPPHPHQPQPFPSQVPAL
jgi:hypothetical protein